MRLHRPAGTSAAKQRTYRRRLRDGTVCVSIPVSEEIRKKLVRLQYLNSAELDDRQAITAAVTAVLVLARG
jgi:hypothetical protein